MKTYTIPVWWTMCGEYKIQAETLAEALRIVGNGENGAANLPEPQEYVDDSLTVNMEAVYELNGKE